MPSRTTTNIVLFVGFVWLSAGLTGCVDRAGPGRSATEPALSPPKSRPSHQAGCVPTFPDHNGWYGADAAYSVPLPLNDGRSSLWLFGDTFVERPGSPEGRTYPFIHNSIGISTCRPGGDWQLETFWQRRRGAQPRAFFEPASDSAWVREARQTSGAPPYYWPFDGFIAHDTLFVGLLRVVESPPRGAFGLPFRLAGMDLARIENFRDAPEDWQIQLSTLSNNKQAFPGSAFVETEAYVYAFAFFDRDGGKSPRMLSRLDLDSLIEWQANVSGSLETWTHDQAWHDGFTPLNAAIVMDDDTSEMSVHFDVERASWLAVYVDPTRDRRIGGPGVVQIRHAAELEGPWSKPRQLLLIPETIPVEHDDNLFCYAGKAHPQFSSPNEMIVSYVCNLFASDPTEASRTLEKLLERSSIYRPQVVSIELPTGLDFNAQKTE